MNLYRDTRILGKWTAALDVQLERLYLSEQDNQLAGVAAVTKLHDLLRVEFNRDTRMFSPTHVLEQLLLGPEDNIKELLDSFEHMTMKHWFAFFTTAMEKAFMPIDALPALERRHNISF